MASPTFEEKRESKDAVEAWTVKVSFPAFEDLPAKTFWWATSKIEVDGEDYDHALQVFPSGSHTTDRGNDRAEFTVTNPNNSVYNTFYPYEDLIERAEVEIKQCFEIELGFYESEIRFFGYLKDFSLEESDKSMKFTAFSDLSRSGFLVGGRIITRERCGTYFNVNGLESPDISPCGWQLIQGGNPLYCSKYLKGADGCASHNNTHRFYAIQGIAEAVISVVSDLGDGGSSGFPYDTEPPCFIAGTKILMADWTLKNIEDINDFDMVMGFDIFTDKLQPTKVLDTFVHRTDQYEEAEFGYYEARENFGITRDHLMSIGNGQFQAYAGVIGKLVEGVTQDGNRCQIRSMASKTVYGDFKTYNFHTQCKTYIIASPNKAIIIKVHNNKRAIAL